MRVLALAVTALAALPPGAGAQESYAGTLSVSRGGAEVGTEQFRLEPGRPNGAPGSTLTITSTYGAAHTRARLERGPDGQLALFQLDAQGPAGPTTIVAAGAGARVLLKTVARGSETGRELPGGPDVAVLDEHAYSLLLAVAALARPAGGRVTIIFPRTGRRAVVLARREAEPGGATRVTLAGELAGTLRLDAAGRLVGMDLPGLGIAGSVAGR